MQHQPHEQSEWDWRLKMKERATPVWRSLEKIPGSSLKHPASGGREKKKKSANVSVWECGMNDEPPAVPPQVHLLNKPSSWPDTCVANLHFAKLRPWLHTPRRPSLRATSTTCLPFSHMNFYRYAAMRVALGNRSGEHLKSRPQSRGSKLRSECKFVAGVL